MSERSLVRVVAQNNAEWCDAFCRTHGVVGRFHADSWFSPVRTPPYYPDAVTLLPEITIEQVLSGIDTSEGCSVKDGFGTVPHGSPIGCDLRPQRRLVRSLRP